MIDTKYFRMMNGEAMKICVMAGGGLSSWYVTAKLASEGHDVQVWLAEVGQHDETFKDLFIQSLHDNGIRINIENGISELADMGLELARFQGCYPNGYWNHTSLLRCYLVGKACNCLPADGTVNVTHGCVGYGNDQRRFTTLFNTLNKNITVETALANWFDTGTNPTRRDMVSYVENWAHLPKDTLLDKVDWSSDGSVLGVSHEGRLIEDVSSDWTQAPFVMTENPLNDLLAEEIELEFDHGQLLRVGQNTDPACDLFQIVNRIAGHHGIGRIGVMENKLRGTKCRGIYEAPALTLLGAVYRQFYDATLNSDEQDQLNKLAKIHALAVYAGEYHTSENRIVREQLTALSQYVTGTAHVVLRGGHFFVKSIEQPANAKNLEQRFAHGGVAWEI